MTGIISGYSSNVQNNTLVRTLLAQLAEAKEARAVLQEPLTTQNDTATKNTKAADAQAPKAEASGCACGLSKNGCSKKCKMLKAYNKH